MRFVLQRSKGMAGKLIQIYYQDDQRRWCFDFSELYFNETLTIFFENAIISDLVPKTQAKSIAICSWKLREKLRWNVPGPEKARELTQEVLDSDYEVLSFTQNSPHHRMFQAAEVWHPGFMKAFDEMLEKIGVSRPMEIKTPIYQNHFSARRDIYLNYIYKYLNPAIAALEIMPVAKSDSGYSILAGRPNAKALQRKIGLSYYPLAPFLLERLFSVFCQNEGIKVSHL